jgi:hypothetical protein
VCLQEAKQPFVEIYNNKRKNRKANEHETHGIKQLLMTGSYKGGVESFEKASSI